jgi:hypothetical protein
MCINEILPGVPQARVIGIERPVISFVLVTTRTTIKQVIHIVISASCLRLEMIDGELTTCICFGHTTVFTGRIGALPHQEAGLRL